MKRLNFKSGNVKLSYLDNENYGKPIFVLLHGHFGNARTFGELVNLSEWHVYSLDQRGHGWSDHAPSNQYRRDDYLNDLDIFVNDVLNNKPFVMLGHSLGGVNAYQYAARNKEIVKALIIEDIGAEVKDDLSFSRLLPSYAPSLETLDLSLKKIGIADTRYFLESANEDEVGWHFRFDKDNLPFSQDALNGVWWEDFMSTECPLLLLHGKKSHVVTLEQIQQMKNCRENTKYYVFENSGHAIHYQETEQFLKITKEFLDSI